MMWPTPASKNSTHSSANASTADVIGMMYGPNGTVKPLSTGVALAHRIGSEIDTRTNAATLAVFVSEPATALIGVKAATNAIKIVKRIVERPGL